MDAARRGNGVDRHLFGLWCAAYEADLPVPELYEDELYSKRYLRAQETSNLLNSFHFLSGGGGNFVLSTSSLGYTVVNGFVGPMCRDGYACFYSITNKSYDFLYFYSAFLSIQNVQIKLLILLFNFTRISFTVSVFRESTKTSAHRFRVQFDRNMMDVQAMLERTVVGAKL